MTKQATSVASKRVRDNVSQRIGDNVKRLGVLDMQACQHREIFEDGRQFLRSSVDLHRITN